VQTTDQSRVALRPEKPQRLPSASESYSASEGAASQPRTCTEAKSTYAANRQSSASHAPSSDVEDPMQRAHDILRRHEEQQAAGLQESFEFLRVNEHKHLPTFTYETEAVETVRPSTTRPETRQPRKKTFCSHAPEYFPFWCATPWTV
jgi:hypothetical protein